MGHGQIKNLYYITHIENIPSILERGILSHERVEEEKIKFTPIYDAEIIASRREIRTPNGKSLWSFANLYFQPRNPMLYRVLREKSTRYIAILAVEQSILNRSDIFISTGNAASSPSEILSAQNGMRAIPQIMNAINVEWWSDVDGSKRKIMAECLVPDFVPPQFIQTIYVPSFAASEEVKAKLPPFRVNPTVIPEPHMFFEPHYRNFLDNLVIVEGDMFFSSMQTITVSVNCVGVMGKGLASKAKYHFPDVYVFYQDLCKKRTLKMGKPYLYKRETSLDYQLADEPSTLLNGNSETWFLLFPTKRHWREPGDIYSIEKGLQWLQDIYKREGIKSLAVPALGCGLGKLEWKDVGPLLCRYLYPLGIPVQIYLPTEKKIPEEFVSENFLLGQLKNKVNKLKFF